MTACNAPAIALHDRDYNDLLLDAVLARRQRLANAEFLFAQLRRARVYAFADLPDGVVSMGIPVRYRLGDQAFTRALLLPDEAALRPGVSVATPLGTALLGLRVGDRMAFEAENGRRVILVEQVASAPDGGLNSNPALERRPNRALEKAFSASDPVSIICTAS